MTPLGVLLHGAGFVLAIKEIVAPSEPKESPLNPEADEEVEVEEAEEFDEEEAPGSTFPNSLDDIDLHRPALGSQQSHANTLMEQAAALGALRDGLRLSGFDEDEAWALTREYASTWWASIYEREISFNDDDD